MAGTRPGGDPTTIRADHDTPLQVVDAGLVPYRTGWAWQRDLARRRAAGDVGDVVLLVEHPPTYTLGRRADPSHVLMDAGQRAAAGIEVVEVDRGGDVTFHGPGQVVGYPIVRLAGPRVVDWVRVLEQANIDMLAHHGVSTRRVDGLTGVWSDAGKVTAIGIRVTAGRVTQHGWATNVDPDLSWFTGIVPCGIDDRPVTSMAALGVDVDLATVRADTVAALADLVAADVAVMTAAALGLTSDMTV